MKYVFTKELDDKIIQTVYEKGFNMQTMEKAVGINKQTYYTIKKRWVFWPATKFRLSKEFVFNFTKKE